LDAKAEGVVAGDGRRPLPVLSLVCAALLFATMAIQLVAIARLPGDHFSSDLPGLAPSALAASTAAWATVIRIPEWRARFLGAAVGIWLTSGWDLQFVLRLDMASVVHWVILSLIGAGILAGWRDGRLPAGRRTLELASFAAVVTGLAIVVIELSWLIIELTIHPLTF
jgi:hypothetical protein